MQLFHGLQMRQLDLRIWKLAFHLPSQEKQLLITLSHCFGKRRYGTVQDNLLCGMWALTANITSTLRMFFQGNLVVFSISD